MVAGYVRWSDGIIMRVMDGADGHPPILLAIRSSRCRAPASRACVVIAISIPEVPRVVRLVRSIVLSIREEPYVEAAVTVGTPTPCCSCGTSCQNCVAPLIVQATFVCAAAILVESILSSSASAFRPEVPSWEYHGGRPAIFPAFPHNILYPGLFIAVTILCGEHSRRRHARPPRPNCARGV